MLKLEKMTSGSKYLIGIDEAGRGPLAGPVAVGVVALNLEQIPAPLDYFLKIRDSKKLSEKKREEWFVRLENERNAGKLTFVTTLVSNKFIDEWGITGAVKHGIREGLTRLNLGAGDCRVLLDGGLRAPAEYQNQQTIIRGDEIEPVIALASICAKVIRDRWLVNLAKKYPKYNLEKHKGYGTKAHYLALEKFGLSPIHRKSFCRRLLKK